MDRQVKRDIWLVNIAGVVGSVYFTLALGEILVLFVTRCLNIPKETWTLVAAAVSLTGVLHLVSAYLTEHFRRRKLMSLTCFALARLAVPAIALLPFITGEGEGDVRLLFLAVALVTRAGLDALGASAWFSWVADIVPSEHRGRFFAIRHAMVTFVNIVPLVFAGRLIDAFGQDNPSGYLIVFGIAFVIGELDLVIHSFVRDRPMPEHEESPWSLSMLAAPWRHAGFRNLMIFQMLNTFGVGLLGPFPLMYRVEELGMTAMWITGMTAVHLAFSVPGSFLWRAAGERVGYRTVFVICQTMIATGMIYYMFLPQGRPAVFLTVMAVAQVWHAIAWGGSILAGSVLTMNVAPEKHRSMYFAQVTAVLGLMGALGLCSGRFIYIYTNPASDIFLPLIGTKLTGTHVIIGCFAILNIIAVRIFRHRIPDTKADAAMPRIERILRTNTLRILPALLPLGRLLPPEEKKKHVGLMRELMNGSARGALKESLDHVLETTVGAEDELHGIIGKEQLREGRGMRRMLTEILESASMHVSPVTAKASAWRIQRLYDEHDVAGCLRAVRRLARRVAERIDTPKAAAAFNIIEAIVEVHLNRPEPQSDAALLAVYACLQMVREPERQG
ncbi:MAG: MFS transporter [Planctomycetota bacterium]